MTDEQSMRSSSDENESGKLVIDVDVSNALRGLKALRREASETVAVLSQLGDLVRGMTPAFDENPPLLPVLNLVGAESSDVNDALSALGRGSSDTKTDGSRLAELVGRAVQGKLDSSDAARYLSAALNTHNPTIASDADNE